MNVGEKIRQKRIEKNMSQDELAKKVGYKSRSSIQKIEASRDLPLRKVKKMADALETTPSYLMGWEDTPSGHSPATVVEVEAGPSGHAYDPAQVEQAMKLFEKYQNAIPEIQTAVDSLLKSQSLGS